VFLWIYWPSFNGATAGGDQQMLTTVNTVMALCASCMATFTVSAIINKRISTVDVQNATLAGGVAIGASSNLAVQPLGAMLIGTLAAVVSVVGFNKVQPILEDKLNLHDSCGVHNLHGMPAILGSLCVTVATSCPSFAKPNDVVFPLGANQPWAQLGGAGATFVIAIASGLLVGVIVKKLLPPRAPAFTDAPYWTVAPTFAKMV
jgi:ammonium transporter Rh